MPSLDELDDGDCGNAEPAPYENHSVIVEVRWVNIHDLVTLYVPLYLYTSVMLGFHQ